MGMGEQFAPRALRARRGKAASTGGRVCHAGQRRWF